MKMKVYDTNNATGNTFNVDGIEYTVYTTDDSHCGTYASVILKDGLTGERFYCNGMIELNNHMFTFRYEVEYNENRDNYICNNNLIIEVL